MDMLLYALSVFSVATFGLSAAGDSTLSITPCKRNSTKFSTCLKHAIKEAWPRFVAGIPELDFAPLDPLSFKYFKGVFNSGEIHGEAIVLNVTAFGLSMAHFSDVRAHFLDDVFRLEIDVQVPKIIVDSAIEVEGTLNIFRFAGKGRLNETADDVRGTWDLIGHVVNDTWIVEHFYCIPSIGKLKIYMEDVIESKELNDLAVAFINEYWPALLRIVMPIAAKEWDQPLAHICNTFFSKVSFSKIFP